MLDLDATLAYDEAEQAEEVPPSTPVSPSVGPFSVPGVPDNSDEVPEPSTRELEPLTPPSCQSLDSDTAGRVIIGNLVLHPHNLLYPPLQILR